MHELPCEEELKRCPGEGHSSVVRAGAEQKECGCEERVKFHEYVRKRGRRHDRRVNLSVAEVGAGRMLFEGEDVQSFALNDGQRFQSYLCISVSSADRMGRLQGQGTVMELPISGSWLIHRGCGGNHSRI